MRLTCEVGRLQGTLFISFSFFFFFFLQKALLFPFVPQLGPGLQGL